MPYYNKDPKRDPNIDNHPYQFEAVGFGLAPSSGLLTSALPGFSSLLPFEKGDHFLQRPRLWHEGDIEAFTIRIGFWGILYYNYKKELPK